MSGFATSPLLIDKKGLICNSAGQKVLLSEGVGNRRTRLNSGTFTPIFGNADNTNAKINGGASAITYDASGAYSSGGVSTGAVGSFIRVGNMVKCSVQLAAASGLSLAATGLGTFDVVLPFALNAKYGTGLAVTTASGCLNFQGVNTGVGIGVSASITGKSGNRQAIVVSVQGSATSVAAILSLEFSYQLDDV